MLSVTLSTDERITNAHRAKLAYVYVRQSSPGQVRHHQESTELQYRLVERATLFGWPGERVHVIDDDLGTCVSAWNFDPLSRGIGVQN
jgi:hypothetical protein